METRDGEFQTPVSRFKFFGKLQLAYHCAFWGAACRKRRTYWEASIVCLIPLRQIPLNLRPSPNAACW